MAEIERKEVPSGEQIYQPPMKILVSVNNASILLGTESFSALSTHGTNSRMFTGGEQSRRRRKMGKD
jgi:hypothetical protein